MTIIQAQGCQKHRQPVELNKRWYYIWAVKLVDGVWKAELSPTSTGHIRGFGYTTVDVSRLK